MQHTTPMVSALEAIDFDLLANVSGGCHKSCCPAPQPPAQPIQQTQIVQAPQAPLAAPPPAPSGDVVSTNVSINGQPAA